MKKYILEVIVTFLIDIALTAALAYLMPYDTSEWLMKLLLFMELILTAVFTWLIFKERYGLRFIGALVLIVIISNVIRFIVNVVNGDWSTVHLLLILISILYIINDELSVKKKLW